MEDRIRYVYKIFDKLNEDKFYIGTTFNINKRWEQHKKNSNSRKLKADMLKFGTQDFDIEIIFEGIEDKVYEKEIELIKELHPYYNNRNDVGGKWGIGNNVGENNPQSKLTEDNIQDICNRIITLGETNSSVAELYKVDRTTISAIVTGRNWDHVDAPRKLPSKALGKDNGKSKITEQDVKDICKRIVINKESVKEVAKGYPIEEVTIRQIINGERWEYVDAPRNKADKRLTEEQIISIRILGKRGKNRQEIKEILKLEKTVRTIGKVMAGKSFSKYSGPIKGKDY